MISPTGITSAAQPVRKIWIALACIAGEPSRNAASASRSLALGEHAMHPAVRIGSAAALDVDEGRAQLFGLGARSAVADHKAAAIKLDRADRRQHRRGAAGEAFPEPPARGILAPLAERIGLLSHRNPRVL